MLFKQIFLYFFFEAKIVLKIILYSFRFNLIVNDMEARDRKKDVAFPLRVRNILP